MRGPAVGERVDHGYRGDIRRVERGSRLPKYRRESVKGFSRRHISTRAG